MKCQNLFSGENKKDIINVLSAELAKSGKGEDTSIFVYPYHSLG